MGHKISKEQIDPGVKDHIMSFVGDVADLETEVNTDIISAVNSLMVDRVDNAENMGKLANAIGEPVTANHSVDEVVEGLGEMLSTFKTNMMNSGVMVESSDKFKQLIDKIKGLTEGEGNKGIQFAEGETTVDLQYIDSSTYVNQTQILDFTPSIVFVTYTGYNNGNDNFSYTVYGNSYTVTETVNNIYFYNSDNNYRYITVYRNTQGTQYEDYVDMYITTSKNKFDVYHCQHNVYGVELSYKWYAIGVGEEDTTLRDSLASILQEEGVNVTEDDDMASLITKVDEEFTKDNNTISEMETDAENTRSTLAGLMQEGGYDITGDEDIDSLLDLLILSGVSVSEIKQICCAGFESYSAVGTTYIVKYDGSLWACGNNIAGELGVGDSGTSNKRTVFTQVTTNINNDVKYVTAGQKHAFILKNDGSVWACGYNEYAGLANPVNVFTQVFTDVKQISSHDEHIMMVKNDGSLWTCGRNDYGQLGLNDTTYRTTFTQVTTNINNDVKQIACGYRHTFIIKNDGTVWACGANSKGQLGLGDTTNRTSFTQVTTNINNDVKQIACGRQHTLILKNDGSVWSCGYNEAGQLGLDDNTTDRNTFTKVTTNINNDVKQIACGYDQTFIIKNDGSLWACGYNEYGQLGLGTSGSSDYKTTFTQVTTNINNDVKQVSGTISHAFILKNDGTIWCCGNNYYGQLGLGYSADTNITTFTMINRSVY